MQRFSHILSSLAVFGFPGIIFGVFRIIIRRDHFSITSAMSGIAASLTASILTGFYLQSAGVPEDLIFGFAGLAALIADFLIEILFKTLSQLSNDPLDCVERWYRIFRRKD